MSKTAQGKVDEFRCGLSPERDAEFLRIANQPNQNITVIHRWLVDEGYKGSYQSVCNWYSNFKKNGEKAERFNQLTQAYTGVLPELALQKIVVIFGNLLDDYLEQIALAEPGAIEAAEYLKLLPHIAREIRSCAGAMHQMKFLGDRRELETSGAFRLAQELRLIFEDSPFSSALEEGLKSALTRMESEG
jgi:hypothetical protein